MPSKLSTYAFMQATCACLSLRKASRVITGLYDKQLASCGLTGTQLSVLVAIALEDGATMTQLAKRLVMDRTTLTRTLRPLKKGGLVKIAAGADPRSRVVKLTPRGRAIVSKAVPVWEQVQARVIEDLGEDRWANLLKGLSAAASLPY